MAKDAEEIKLLWIGCKDDPVQSKLEKKLKFNKIIVHKIRNIADCKISFPKKTPEERKIAKIQDGKYIFYPEEEKTIIFVVNLFVNNSFSVNDQETKEYINKENYAVWIALLSQASCKVINRPSKTFFFDLLSRFRVRNIARQLLIPTIDEKICSGSEILKMNTNSADYAIVDLFTNKVLLPSNLCEILLDRHYSIVSTSQNSRYIICILLNSEYLSYIYDPITVKIDYDYGLNANLAEKYSSTLNKIFELSYAAFIFVLTEDKLVFSRLQTHMPNFIGDDIQETIVEKLFNFVRG